MTSGLNSGTVASIKQLVPVLTLTGQGTTTGTVTLGTVTSGKTWRIIGYNMHAWADGGGTGNVVQLKKASTVFATLSLPPAANVQGDITYSLPAGTSVDATSGQTITIVTTSGGSSTNIYYVEIPA